MLFNAKHGLNDFDISMLAHIAQFDRGFTVQPIITKVDAIPTARIQLVIAEMRVQIAEHAPPGLLPPILTSVQKQHLFGIEEVQSSILEACGISED